MNLKNIVISNIHGVDYCVLLMELAKLIAMCLTNIGRYQIKTYCATSSYNVFNFKVAFFNLL